MTQISEDQISKFLDSGYLILPALFSSQEVEILLNKANSLEYKARNLSKNLADSEVHPVKEQGSVFVIQNIEQLVKIHRIVWAGAAEPDLLNISKQSKLLTPISQLLESPKAAHIINSLHLKLPNDGVEFSIHQDIHHRRNYDSNWENINGGRTYVVCVTSINSMTENNGPIMIIAGSHKQGEIPRDHLKDRFEFNTAIPLLLEPGDTACMHQYLVHWSLPNESSDSRLVLINGFAYPGANHSPYPGDGSGVIIELE